MVAQVICPIKQTKKHSTNFLELKTGLLSSREFVRHITRLRLQSSVEKAQEIVGADCTPFSTSATPTTKRVTCQITSSTNTSQ